MADELAAMKYIGVDGCRGGWFMVGLAADGGNACKLLHHIDELDAYLAAAQCILIDIPIGLLRHETQERACDKQTRKILGRPRGSSVFPAPSRCALHCISYQAANAHNVSCSGRGLSRQSFGILPKIREVDSYLDTLARRRKIHEMHPELCFWALNQHMAMRNNKKTRAGFAERLAVLTRHYRQAQDAIATALQQYPRSRVARDDIVDALVGAVTARHAQALRHFPENPAQDEKGLVMEIVYPGKT
jgi:predicted RNase H-like nuclease